MGSSQIVIAGMCPNGVDVLVNQSSYRQTPTTVCFGDIRTTGDMATSKIKKDVTQAIFTPQRFLGEITHERLKHEMNHQYCNAYFQEQNHVGFEVRLGNQKGSLVAEQVMVGVFSEAMSVLRFNEIVPAEVVISVPDSFGQAERVAMLTAAKISGLPIAKLINESAANVLNYSLFRRGEFEAEKPRIVGFVDVGHSKTSVYFAAITVHSMEVLCEVHNDCLGCRDLDYLISQFYIKLIKQKHKVDIQSNKKLIYRLNELIVKQRTTLTINAEAPLVLEAFDGDQDFSYLMKREEMEKIGAEFFKGVKTVLENALKALPKEHKKNLHSVERVGGGTRIPAVEKLIVSTLKVSAVSKTLDASESIARGCAVQAGFLSPNFPVSNYRLRERLPYAVSIKMQIANQEPQAKTLFEAGTEYYKRQSITMNRIEQLTIALYVPSRTNYEERAASYTQIAERQKNQELVVYAMLDGNGVVYIENAVVTTVGSKKDQSGPVQPLAIIVTNPGELPPDILQRYRELEIGLLKMESVIQETQEAKNRLESLVYFVRAKLNDSLAVPGLTPAEKTRFMNILEQFESWAYGEGASVDKEQYLSKINELEGSFRTLAVRWKGYQRASELLNQLNSTISKFEANVLHKTSALPAQEQSQISQSLAESRQLISELTNFGIQPIQKLAQSDLSREADKIAQIQAYLSGISSKL